MKKQNKFMEFLNSKGFYTALFTCLFAVLAIAAFVSIRNIDAITKLTTYGEKDIALDELRPVGSQEEKPLSEVAERDNQTKRDTPAESPSKSVPPSTKTEQPKTIPERTPVTPKPQVAPVESKQDKTGQLPEPNVSQQAKTEAKPKEEPVPETKQESSAEPAKPEEKPEQKPEQKAAPQASVNGGEDMDWPLDDALGTIVMNFSTEHTIYDKTLEQYRTNPTVSIGSDVGTQVKAAADGVVESIAIDPRTGYTLIIDHGNGWQTVYGQLQETILVKEGDAVAKGQAVGGVGTPTKYGVLLGPHLVFGVKKDDVPLNPSVVLAE